MATRKEERITLRYELGPKSALAGNGLLKLDHATVTADGKPIQGARVEDVNLAEGGKALEFTVIVPSRVVSKAELKISIR